MIEFIISAASAATLVVGAGLVRKVYKAFVHTASITYIRCIDDSVIVKVRSGLRLPRYATGNFGGNTRRLLKARNYGDMDAATKAANEVLAQLGCRKSYSVTSRTLQ